MRLPTQAASSSPSPTYIAVFSALRGSLSSLHREVFILRARRSARLSRPPIYRSAGRWNEHRLQGRVQINIKLNYNDSVYQGGNTRGRARCICSRYSQWMARTLQTLARLVIFYAMYINTAMARMHALVSNGAFTGRAGMRVTRRRRRRRRRRRDADGTLVSR